MSEIQYITNYCIKIDEPELSLGRKWKYQWIFLEGSFIGHVALNVFQPNKTEKGMPRSLSFSSKLLLFKAYIPE